MNDDAFYRSIANLISKGWIVEGNRITSPPMKREHMEFFVAMVFQ